MDIVSFDSGSRRIEPNCEPMIFLIKKPFFFLRYGTESFCSDFFGLILVSLLIEEKKEEREHLKKKSRKFKLQF